MNKLTTAQLLAGYAPIAGGIALAGMSTTLAIRYHADLVNVSMAMFGGFVGGVAVMGAALSEIAYHWPRPVVPPVVPPPDTAPAGYSAFQHEAHSLIDLRPPLPPYFNWRVARRVAWAVTVRGEPLTQARLSQVMSKGNSAKLMAWLMDERLIKWRGRDRRAGVVLTGAGMDWMEAIKAAYGPPPVKTG